MAKAKIPVVESDVLVIGGGLAGCWAAHRASGIGAKVVLVDRGKVSRSGKSSFSGASILCPLPTDDMAAWQKEMARRGDYVNDQDWITVILQEQGTRIKDMEDMGIEFERDKGGALIRSVGIAHGITRVTNVNCFHMMETFRKRLLEEGVKLHEKTMVMELLTEDGLYPTRNRVCGALGFDIRDGSPVVFQSGAIVIATGGTGLFDQSGDGIAQSFRSGAEISNIEFGRTYGVGSVGKYGGFHLNTWQRLGWYLRNARGERFMERYEPEQMERADRKQLGPAIATEYLEGRGPVYIDVTHFSPQNLETLRTLFTTSEQIHTMEKDGIDLRRDKITIHATTGSLDIDRGGIRHNLYCETSLPGLFVAGEAGGYPGHGTYSVGGVNLAHCCVEGYHAGENSWRYAREMGRASFKEEQARAFYDGASLVLKNKKGKSPDNLKGEVTSFFSAADISIFRTARSLRKALKTVDEFRKEVPSLKARDWAEVMKVQKMQNYLACTQLVFQAALLREESRAAHIRMDHPYRDNLNWLKWVVLKPEERKNRIAHSFVPVPIYRYGARPEKYEKEPYPMPLPKVKI